MSKFIYLQDLHFSGVNSAHYISNYFEDCLEMFDEILSIAKENKVDAILDGGDLLDTSEPAYRILDEIADRVEKIKIPIYSLFGNHAERYHSMEHSRYTGLAHLQKRSKYFKYLRNIQTKDFHLCPIEYSHNIEEELKKLGIVFSKTTEWKIAIVHAFITPKPFLKEVCHICVDDIKTNADLVLVSHYHTQWEKIIGNTKYLDIGCIGRRSITEKDITPSILLINTAKRSTEIIPLKSAKKGDEIFDLSKIDEKKEFKADIEKFIKSIESTDFQSTNIKDTIKYIGKEKNVDKEVVDLIVKKIGDINEHIC